MGRRRHELLFQPRVPPGYPWPMMSCMVNWVFGSKRHLEVRCMVVLLRRKSDSRRIRVTGRNFFFPSRGLAVPVECTAQDAIGAFLCLSRWPFVGSHVCVCVIAGNDESSSPASEQFRGRVMGKHSSTWRARLVWALEGGRRCLEWENRVTIYEACTHSVSVHFQFSIFNFSFLFVFRFPSGGLET